MVTAGLLWMAGDVVAQYLEHRWDHPGAAAAAATSVQAVKRIGVMANADADADADFDDDDDDDDGTYHSTSSSDLSRSTSQTELITNTGNTVEIDMGMPPNGPPVVADDATRPPLDWHRTRIQTLYAALLWGPAGHWWYEWLDRLALSLAPAGEGTAPFVGVKLTLEIILLHPVALSAFFVCVGLMSNERIRDIVDQLRSDFLPSLMLEYLMWIPCDLAMFSFIPARHQLLMVNTICLVESVMLSYIKSNGISLPGRCYSVACSYEGKKKDEYRQMAGDVIEGDNVPTQDAFGDHRVGSRPNSPTLLPAVPQRLRGWRRRKQSQSQLPVQELPAR